MKNSLLKIYILVVSIIFAGTIVYFGGGLAYEYTQNNLNAGTINFYAKVSFCIILFFTALTLVMICLVAKHGIIDDSKDVIDDGNVSAEPEVDVDESEILEDTNEIENKEEVSEEVIIEDEPAENEESNESTEFDAESYDNFDDDDSFSLDDFDDIEDPEVEMDEESEVDLEEEELLNDILDTDEDDVMPEMMGNEIPEPVSNESTNFDGTQAMGLYNSKTGICWESYLNSRLENELVRASASEYDLVCFVVKMENIDRNSEKGKAICDYLSQEFQFKDLIFEYKNDCVVCIKTNYSIDDAIDYGEKLYAGIGSMLDEGEECYIGISSRTIRMVSAERLLKEAEQAMFHAVSDGDSNIIAFRANAEKYMEMMNK